MKTTTSLLLEREDLLPKIPIPMYDPTEFVEGRKQNERSPNSVELEVDWKHPRDQERLPLDGFHSRLQNMPIHEPSQSAQLLEKWKALVRQ